MANAATARQARILMLPTPHLALRARGGSFNLVPGRHRVICAQPIHTRPFPAVHFAQHAHLVRRQLPGLPSAFVSQVQIVQNRPTSRPGMTRAQFRGHATAAPTVAPVGFIAPRRAQTTAVRAQLGHTAIVFRPA